MGVRVVRIYVYVLDVGIWALCLLLDGRRFHNVHVHICVAVCTVCCMRLAAVAIIENSHCRNLNAHYHIDVSKCIVVYAMNKILQNFNFHWKTSMWILKKLNSTQRHK